MFHKRLVREFKDNRKMIADMVAAQWIMLLANTALMLSAANYIASLILYNDALRHLWELFAALAAVLVIRGMMTYFHQERSFQISKQLKERLRTMLHEKMMRMGSGYRKTIKTAEAVQICTEGVEQLEIYFGKYMPQFFYSMLAPLTLFAIAATMSMKVALVLLLCIPLIPISIVAVQKFAKKLLAKYWGIYTELGDSFLECLQGLTTLKIYQADERYAKKMEAEAEQFRKVTMRVLIMQLNSISIMDMVAYGGSGIGIILSIVELQNSRIGLAECFFLIMISAEFFLPLRLLGSFFHIAMNGNAAADKIFRLLDAPEPGQAEVQEMEELEGSAISLHHVSFGYEKEKQILKDITLQAQKGLTALVGESGCGKSTIASMLAGDIFPQQGEVKVGGTASQYISPAVMNRKITRIRHDSYLFAGTVQENLRMGKPDASEEEMYQALKQVRLDGFIKANGGLDRNVAEGAFNLSGGQRQRLALARALLHDTDIYIFDEASSNVDVESENDIMAVVKKLSETKTVILISHRLANVTDAGQIYVMKDGRIAEYGRHRQLYAKGEHYYELYHQQMMLEQCRREEAEYAS